MFAIHCYVKKQIISQHLWKGMSKMLAGFPLMFDY